MAPPGWVWNRYHPGATVGDACTAVEPKMPAKTAIIISSPSLNVLIIEVQYATIPSRIWHSLIMTQQIIK